MTAAALLFTLAALGISETVYLIRKRIASQKPFCPLGESCTLVLSSDYSKLFFIPNDILGLLFYIVSSVITAFLVIGVGPVSLWIFSIRTMVILGSLLSIYFVYLQWQVIRAWCFWCVMSALTVWLMGVILFSSSFFSSVSYPFSV